MHFASTWNHLLKHCIFVEFLLVEGYMQGALRKELRIAPFVESFETASLGRSYWWILPVLKTVLMNFASTWNNLFKDWISSEFLLMECYVQGALRKELHIVPFVEHFKTTTLGKRHW